MAAVAVPSQFQSPSAILSPGSPIWNVWPPIDTVPSGATATCGAVVGVGRVVATEVAVVGGLVGTVVAVRFAADGAAVVLELRSAATPRTISTMPAALAASTNGRLYSVRTGSTGSGRSAANWSVSSSAAPIAG